MPDLKSKIEKIISSKAYLAVDEFMEICLYDEDFGYYRTKNAIGKDADFITAPEISQLFGEVLALYIINQIENNFNRDDVFEVVELGGGRGVLMEDILRVFSKFPEVYKRVNFNILDVSEALIAKQKERLKNYLEKIKWIKSLDELKTSSKLVFLANEFFDALPTKQFIYEDNKWHERVIIVKDGELKFHKIEAKKLPDYFSKIIETQSNKKPKNLDIKEFSNLAVAYAQQICNLLNKNKGLMVCLDYGYLQSDYGDSLQGVRLNKYANIFENLGETDLTTHVDFALLKMAFSDNIITDIYTSTQREFLISTGIIQRAEMLAKNKGDKVKNQIYLSLSRLIDRDKMGDLFKCFIAQKLH